jgi:hypothetical protein
MKLMMFSLLALSMFFGANSDASAKAKKTSLTYSLFEDGGEHPATCNREKSLPKDLEKKNEFKADRGYLGSLQVEFADKNEAGIDAWKHFFNGQKACKVVEARLNESYEQGEEDL